MGINSLKQYFVSMEELDEVIVEGDDLDATTIEVMSDFDEAEITTTDVEELNVTGEGLEAIVEALEVSLEHGGLDPMAAQFASMAVAAYTDRLGIANSVPSLESFGGDAGRISSTTVSMEGIKDTLKRIYEVIKAAVEKAIRAVRDFFAKLFGGVDKVISKAEELEKKIKEKDDKKATADTKATVKVPQPNTLGVAGSAKLVVIMQGLNTLKEHNSEVFTGVLGAATAKMNGLSNAITASDENKIEENVGKALATANSGFAKVSGGKLASGNKTIVKTQRESSVLKGGITSLSYTTDARAKAVSGDTEIPVLKYGEMSTIVGIVKEIMKNTKDKKKSIEDLSKAREDVIKDLKKVVDDSERSKVGGFWVKAKGQAIMRLAQMDDSRVVHQIAAWNFSVARAALALVNVSLSKYKEPKAS